jgi:hypothetical protein
MVLCPRCGFDIHPSFRFCPMCATPSPGVPPGYPPAPYASPPPLPYGAPPSAAYSPAPQASVTYQERVVVRQQVAGQPPVHYEASVAMPGMPAPAPMPAATAEDIVECAFCEGEGRRPFHDVCPGCQGKGRVRMTRPWVPCASCDGEGHEKFAIHDPCRICGGKGKVNP